MEEYEALAARVPDVIESLRSEFDELVSSMQSPTSKRAARALFKATRTGSAGTVVKLP